MSNINLNNELIEELKKILGDDYPEVRDFYYNACINPNYNYKVFLTRRSYVLFRIFVAIFKTENPNFKVLGEIYNTHSLNKLINSELNNTNVLILDDIIINGRTIKNVLQQLKNKAQSLNKITIWCVFCNSEAPLLEHLHSFMGHVRYVSGYKWKTLSNKLTEFIVASNIGYVSFVNSYYVSQTFIKNLEKVFDKNNVLDVTNDLFKSKGIRSKIVFYKFAQDLTPYHIYSCIRIYEKQEDITIIPYVFLPSLKKEDCVSYCKAILSVFNEKIPESLIFENSEKIVYQWTIQQISQRLYFELLNKLNSGYASCNESYKIASPILEQKKWDVNFLYESKNSGECTKIFSDILNKTSFKELSVEGISALLRNYLDEVHRIDDNKAVNREDRCIGISINQIMYLLNNYVQNNEYITYKILGSIINTWDIGLSSYVIEETCADDGTKIIDGLVKNGEQAYRIYLEDNDLLYAVFYYYYIKTLNYEENAIMNLAKYLDSKFDTNIYTRFVKNLDKSNYFDDIKVIKPNVVSSSIEKELKCVDEYIKVSD